MVSYQAEITMALLELQAQTQVPARGMPDVVVSPTAPPKVAPPEFVPAPEVDPVPPPSEIPGIKVLPQRVNKPLDRI